MRLWEGKVGEIAGDVAVCCALAWSVLAIGCTLPWAVAGLLALAFLSALVNGALGRFRLDAGVVVLLALGCLALLQSLPLPLSTVSALDRETGETWGRVFGLLGHVGRAALSLEPQTTRVEGVRLLSYALTWGAVSGTAKRQGPLVVARWVTWIVVATAVLTFTHRLLGVNEVYGVYPPQYAGTHWVGPLLNPNNLGGLSNLGVFCALACSSRRGGEGRPAYFAVAAALVCLTILTGSRGAVISLAGGLGLFSLMWIRAREHLPKLQHWGLVYGAVSALTLAALSLDDSTLADLSGRSVEKLSLLGWGLKVLGKHPWFGVGMGAFGAEAATVSGLAGNVVFPYVECFPLDLVTGFGIAVGLTTFGLVLAGLLRIGGRLRTRTLRLGLLVVLIQNFLDLGLQVPGVAVPWLAVFAACWGGATRRTWSHPGSKAVWAVISTAGLLGATAAFPIAETAGGLRAEVSHWIGEPDARQRLDVLLSRYPGDAYLLRTRAALSARAQQPDALAWVNAALLRAPEDGRTHLLLAQLLVSKGKIEQALPSLRKAAMDSSLHSQVAGIVWRVAPSRANDVAPENLMGAGFLRFMASHRAGEERVALLREAQRRAPQHADTLVELTMAQVRVLTAQSRSCPVGSTCHADLAAAIDRAWTLGATSQQVQVLGASLQALAGDQRGAFEGLMAGCERSLRNGACVTTLLELAARLDASDYERAAQVYLDVMCGASQASCGKERMKVADALLSRGSIAAAHQLYVQECGSSGVPRAFLQAASTAARLGRDREAWHWLNKGQQQHRADAAVQAQLARLKAQIERRGLESSPPHTL